MSFDDYERQRGKEEIAHLLCFKSSAVSGLDLHDSLCICLIDPMCNFDMVLVRSARACSVPQPQQLCLENVYTMSVRSSTTDHKFKLQPGERGSSER